GAARLAPVTLFQPEVAPGRDVVHLPLVVGEVGPGVGLDLLGVERHRPHVVLGVVVGVEGLVKVGRGAGGGQVPAGGHDGVVGVVDVAAPAPAGPGAGQELHRALGAGGARAPDAA